MFCAHLARRVVEAIGELCAALLGETWMRDGLQRPA
jgi:hypothetical protein